ncbi:MAG TPA: hypothetical protein VD931_18120 [Baekduia sp.]|nr:hypothetical protein [Baekduia sp.]
MPRDAGQASLEYVGLVAVLAGVLAAATLAGAGSGALAGTVAHEVHRALCVVTAGDCDRDRAPCVVRSRALRDHWGARILWVRLGAGWAGVVETLSDGRVVVSRVREDELGLDGGTGAQAGLALGRAGRLALGGEVRAAVLAHRRDGLSWTVRSAAQARALLHRLAADRWASASGSGILRAIVDRQADLPAPDEVHGERDWGVTLGGSGSAGEAAGSLSLSAQDAWGTRRLRDGRRVLYLRRTAALDAALGLGELVDGGASAARDATVGVEVDAAGRPRDLVVVETGVLEGSRDLPAEVSEASGLLSSGSGSARGARGWVVERHLDLTVPANLAAARAAIAAARGGARVGFGDPTTPGAALRARLAGAAVVHARTFAVDATSHGGEVGGAVAGVGLGLEGGHDVTTTRLLAAATRGLDGRWVRRDDCLPAG